MNSQQGSGALVPDAAGFQTARLSYNAHERSDAGVRSFRQVREEHPEIQPVLLHGSRTGRSSRPSNVRTLNDAAP